MFKKNGEFENMIEDVDIFDTSPSFQGCLVVDSCLMIIGLDYT